MSDTPGQILEENIGGLMRFSLHQAEVTHATPVIFHWLERWSDLTGREKGRTASEERGAKADMGEH